jgi:tetratricopeptide (TPR) repeat protein
LFGPIGPSFVGQVPPHAHQAGECLTFGTAAADVPLLPDDTWHTLAGRFPPDWGPDLVVLSLARDSVPAFLLSAPVPIVGLATDWARLWHGYCLVVPHCDLVLTDEPGVELMQRAGTLHARPANLFGLERPFLPAPAAERPRDIDILFVGDLPPAGQPERLAWLARLVRLGTRWRVSVAMGASGEEYRSLLTRARIVFDCSAGAEHNQRMFEAAACGAALFQEAANRDACAYFEEGKECVCYDEENLDKLLDYYLTHEEERCALAEAARVRVSAYGSEASWDLVLEAIVAEWPALQDRASRRTAVAGDSYLPARAWQAVSGGQDPTLERDIGHALSVQPRSAELHNALGLAVALRLRPHNEANAPAADEVAAHFRDALAMGPWSPVIALNVAEALVGAGRDAEAVPVARNTLARLEGLEMGEAQWLTVPQYPPGLHVARIEWEKAAWSHAGQPRAEASAKINLLRWRLHVLLADLTGDLVHYHEAALARPDQPTTRAALGCALGRAGRPVEALGHLRFAVQGAPFDLPAARALAQALRDAGDHAGAARLAQERWLLHRAAPDIVPVEPWFADNRLPDKELPAPRRDGPQRVSLCLIVKNEEANLPDCLASVEGLFHEVVVVDTGSTDRTKEVAAAQGARVFDFPWVDSFAAARNEALHHATGDWAFWLDADDRLGPADREKMRSLLAGLKDENAAYVMKCVCDGQPGTSATVVDHVRLFRLRPEVRWEHRVHEQILPALRRCGADVRWCDVAVRHVGYRDPAVRRTKLERDLRLLHQESAEQPDHPFTLFNLGSVYQELGRHAEALPLLRRSLERSHVRDSIVRKLYALIVGCHQALGQADQALMACREGLGHYPDDTELLFVASVLLKARGDQAGAIACGERLVSSRPDEHFASVDAGLRGYKGRTNLAVMYHEAGRAAEAEAQWHQALGERPDFLPAWLGLAELYLTQQRWHELEETARRTAAEAGGWVEGQVLRARGLLARQDFAGARGLLEQAIGRAPRALWPRVILSHCLLQEGRDFGAAERALLDVLALSPEHAEARSNLMVLRRRQEAGKPRGLVNETGLAQLYRSACTTPSDIHEHLPLLYALARRCRHVTEVGTRSGASTTALLYGQPEVLVCYGTAKAPAVERLEGLAGHTAFRFHRTDVLPVEIEETEVLFLDTWQVGDHLPQQLARHAGKAGKYIILSGTTLPAEVGDTEPQPEAWATIEELVREGTFRIKQRLTNNNGLTVLERVSPGGSVGSQGQPHNGERHI